MNVPASRILEELRMFVRKHETQGAAAKALKVTPSVLSLTLSNQVNVIPEKILRKLGYVQQIVYVRKSKKGEPVETPTNVQLLEALAPAKNATKKATKKATKATKKPALVSAYATTRATKTATPTPAARAPRQAPRPVVIAEDAPAERNSAPSEPVFMSVRD